MEKKVYDPNTIYYSLPDFYNYYKLNLILMDMIQQHPGWFRQNFKIESMYGTFPGCIWNSGRGQYGQAAFKNIAATIAGLNQRGISIRFTFTNKFIEVPEFSDRYGNAILELGHTGMNGVNVSVPAFADYIQHKYPEYYLLWSTTKGVQTLEGIDELSKDRLTVPPYNMSNTDIVEQFAHPENIELLCCETCIDNCPDRQNHYADIAKGQMYMLNDEFKCPHGCELYYFYETVPTRKHHITPEMIEDIYLPLGINKFKISGRNDNVINVVERYVEYFPLPEYKDTVRNHLLIDVLN